MYDLNKIIVIGSYDLDSQEGLETVVMKTDGMKVTDLLYINDKGSLSDDDIIDDLKSELYSDMYDDDLNIKIAEAYNGTDALEIAASFIDDIWDKESQLYYYEPDDENFDKLKDELELYNGKIYLSKYHDIFVDGEEIGKDIVDIMKDQGLKTENMLQDSTISFIYFLHGLIEKVVNR